MRIGINALYLLPGGVGGTEIYLRSLLRAFGETRASHEFVLFTNAETGDQLDQWPGLTTDVQPVRARNRPARLLYEQFRLPAAVRRHRCDVLFNPGFTAPAWPGCPQVTVFHDLQHKRHPEYFRWFDLPFWNLFLAASARRSDRLIAVSQATAAGLQEHYGLGAGRVRVVEHGVDPEFFAIGRERTQQDEQPYLLCVSTLHPHKNLERLIRAFLVFQQEQPQYRLVIAGLHGFHYAPLLALVRSRGAEESVRFTGWIPREALYNLFRHARSFVYPSTFEGFGMPILEALAAGIPTACSSIEPLRTVAGEAAVLFPPTDETALLNAMRQVTMDEETRERLAVAGPARAAQFSWTTAARQTLAVLEDAAGSSPGGSASFR